MPKKLSKNIDYFEDYRLLALVSNLKDYSLCFHINRELKLDLAKHEDLFFDFASEPQQCFSWYYYYELKNHSTYYLIGNKSEGSYLMPSQKTVDYFLLIKDVLNEEAAKATVSSLRKIPYISAVFDVDMQRVSGLESLMETIELHELEFIKK